MNEAIGSQSEDLLHRAELLHAAQLHMRAIEVRQAEDRKLERVVKGIHAGLLFFLLSFASLALYLRS